MNAQTPVRVYQTGFEVPELAKPLVSRILHSDRICTLLVPEHALIFNRGMYRGLGNHIPGQVTLMLGHNYRTRNVEDDFCFMDAALIAWGHSNKENIHIAPAVGNEAGLDNLQTRFNFYRAMRGVEPDVRWENA